MRLYEFQVITEDYTSSSKRFIQQGADPAEVEAALDFHKQWKNTFDPERNQYNPAWKNIDSVADWKAFKKFIDAEDEYRKIKDQMKASSNDQLVLREDAEWFIVVPLNHQTSCFHGRHSNWCTTKEDQSAFSDYFFIDWFILIYCFSNDDPKKKMWAIALDLYQLSNSEFFDYPNHKIDYTEFEEQTGLSLKEIIADVKKNLKVINKQREANEKTDFYTLLNRVHETGKRNKYVEKLIIWFKKVDKAYDYAYNIIQGPWPEAEPVIAKDPVYAYTYAKFVINGRFPEGEPAIAQNEETALNYALNIIKGPWTEAEPVIAADPVYAYVYAKKILKDPDPKTWAERYLAKHNK